MSDTRIFLNKLFGEKPNDQYVLLWTLPAKLSSWHRNTEDAVSNIERITGQDVYFGVGLSAIDRGPSVRCPANDVSGITCLWADIDWADRVHKKPGLAPDPGVAMGIITDLPLRPTVIVNSGHGYQCYWCFKEPWMFESNEDREKAIRFAMQRVPLDAVVIGFKSNAEIDEAIQRMNRALAEIA